jgi:hypothetical protein
MVVDSEDKHQLEAQSTRSTDSLASYRLRESGGALCKPKEISALHCFTTLATGKTPLQGSPPKRSVHVENCRNVVNMPRMRPTIATTSAFRGG